MTVFMLIGAAGLVLFFAALVTGNRPQVSR